MLDEDDKMIEFLQSPECEGMAEELWRRAVTAAGQNWDELEDRGGVLPPEQTAAITLMNLNGDVSREYQDIVLDEAANYGEEMIRRTEIELAEMRRALIALRQPRANLLRSRIGLVKPDGPHT